MAATIVDLPAGFQVGTWCVVKKLGEGSYGAVYKVSDPTGSYAMKLEGQDVTAQLLKVEATVLTAVSKTSCRHFCKVMDMGQFAGFNFVVMTLAGKTLHELRKEGPYGHFTLGSALGAGIQTLEALEDLHSVGFLHRDVKPGNYTVGRAELKELRKIYLLDFGMCRKFANKEGVVRKPRASAGFRGTVKYAPIATHMQRELCRKDDVESWIYLLVEITTGSLPWKNMLNVQEVGECKKKCVDIATREDQPIGTGNRWADDDTGELFLGCPSQYVQILRHLSSLKFFEVPLYQLYYDAIKLVCKLNKLDQFPYDWEK